MTAQEIQKQTALEQSILQKLKERRAQGIRGDRCETEFRTNAEVCVTLQRAELDCNQSYLGNYYNDCDATIRSDLETNYSGGSYLDVDVECRVEIEYHGRRSCVAGTDSGRKDESREYE